MGKGENTNRLRGLKVDNVIRKPGNGRSANRQVRRKSRDQPTRGGPQVDKLQCFVHGCEQLAAKSGAPVAVPLGRFIEFVYCFGFDAKRLLHRFFSPASVRWRTSSQGSPADSPLKTRRARLSISAAQAASSSAGSSGGPSKLASSSATRWARSFGGKVKASRNKSCTRDVMRSF